MDDRADVIVDPIRAKVEEHLLGRTALSRKLISAKIELQNIVVRHFDV